jgi:hypothetical protein
MEELPVMTPRWWVRPLHIMLGSLVVAVGAWLASDTLSLSWVVLLAVAVVGLLSWQGYTIGLTWAWATLLLGLESLAWPLVTMVQIRQATTDPNDEQMGVILLAVVAGLFSAVFWISFSYGLFKRAGRQHAAPPATPLASQPVAQIHRPRKKR